MPCECIRYLHVGLFVGRCRGVFIVAEGDDGLWGERGRSGGVEV